MADDTMKFTLGAMALAFGSQVRQKIVGALTMAAMYQPVVDAVAKTMATAEGGWPLDESARAIWRSRSTLAIQGLRDYLKAV